MEKKETAVTNSNTLIFIAKLNIFNLAKNLFSTIYIPEQVLKEILDKQSPENLLVKKELQQFLKQTSPKEIKNLPLGEGESAAISFCIEKNIKTFLSDDKKARSIASSLDLKTIGIIGILLFNLQNKNLNKEETEEILNKAIQKGYYLSPELYAEVISLIKNV